MQNEVIDAEFTQNGVDPTETQHVVALARRQEEQRAQLALGAAQAIAMAQKEKSLMEARMSIARERPRDWMMVRSKLMTECQRPGFADAAIYSKPVGGQNIEGMSIRFAEACVRAAGNLRITTELVEDGPKHLTYRATVMDLESGSSYDEEFTFAKTVERSTVGDGRVAVGERKNTRGKTVYLLLATEDELANKKGAASSKLIRNAVLRLMPGDIVDECRQACERTIASKDAKNPALARNQLLDAFALLGVTPRQVAEYLDRESAEVITPAEVARMRPIHNALKQGETTWKDICEAKPSAKPVTVAPPLPIKPAAPAPQAQPAVAAAPTTSAEPVELFDVIVDELGMVDSMAGIDALNKKAKGIAKDHPRRQELGAAFNAARARVKGAV